MECTIKNDTHESWGARWGQARQRRGKQDAQVCSDFSCSAKCLPTDKLWKRKLKTVEKFAWLMGLGVIKAAFLLRLLRCGLCHILSKRDRERGLQGSACGSGVPGTVLLIFSLSLFLSLLFHLFYLLLFKLAPRGSTEKQCFANLQWLKE